MEHLLEQEMHLKDPLGSLEVLLLRLKIQIQLTAKFTLLFFCEFKAVSILTCIIEIGFLCGQGTVMTQCIIK